MSKISPESMNKYLVSTEYFDFNHPKIDILAQQIKGTSAKEIAVDIYYLVRDAYAYNPYRVFDGINSFKASFCLETGDGYCIPKVKSFDLINKVWMPYCLPC